MPTDPDDDLPTDPKIASLIRTTTGVVAEVTRFGRDWIAVCCRSAADRDRAAKVLEATGAFREAEERRDYPPAEGLPREFLAYFAPVKGAAPEPGSRPN